MAVSIALNDRAAEAAPALPSHPLLLVRHGQTEWNVAARCQGQLDSNLTTRGRAQADHVGSILRRLVEAIPDWRETVRLVASPLGRTMETARIINRHLDLPIQQDARIAEVSFGRWEGMTRDEIYRANPWLSAHGPHGWQFRAPAGERYEQVQARLFAFLAEIDRPTIAISHGMSGRILRGHYAGLSPERAVRLAVPQDRVWRLTPKGVEELG
ncbi:probable phosphoglycerate mutase [Azospirillum sp. RU38E]|nr:probable phosphoglycerate mutase [Azospirillum sp. RU38E]SNT21812.1 probable phosphoglycerate mutase [Azospirillum sp. RU37A]